MPSLDALTARTPVIRALSMAAAVLLASAALAMPASAGDHSTRSASLQRVALDPLHSRLNGAKEVPGPGDPDGRGTVTIRLKPAVGKVCAHATWTRIGKPVAAHIHQGRAGVAGDVVVDLTGSVTGGRHCAGGVSRALIRRIAAHPKRFYFNIHTVAFSAGAIRGQLHR